MGNNKRTYVLVISVIMTILGAVKVYLDSSPAPQTAPDLSSVDAG